MKTIIYARVSTRGGRQELDNQLEQLRTYCKFKGYEIVDEVVDERSGIDSEREGFNSLFSRASKGEYE